jgi:hypothetical protein
MNFKLSLLPYTGSKDDETGFKTVTECNQPSFSCLA